MAYIHIVLLNLLAKRHDLEDVAVSYDATLVYPFTLHFKSGLNHSFDSLESIVAFLKENP